jgi:upstream activation factor subunit UAF30
MATAKQGAGKKTQSDTKKAKGDDKKSTAKKSAGGSAKGGGNQGLAKPVQPSADLAPVVGKNPMPRTEITKKVWDYIKANDLQDPANRRMINADDKLRPVFGGKDQVSMFEMTKLVNQHLK